MDTLTLTPESDFPTPPETTTATTTAAPPAERPRFSDFPLREELLRAIEAAGYTHPTPIQAAVLPPLLDGRDIFGQAQTGSGKTAAFGIPTINRLRPTGVVGAIVLVPTRELCRQVTDELEKLAQGSGLHILSVYGGTRMRGQFTALERGVDIVVGTPGRVIDHLGRGTLQIDRVKIVILDEADEMLDIGFAEDIERILRRTPRERQTMLFSATMPGWVQRLVRRYQRSPVHIAIESEHATVATVAQRYYEVAERDKLEGFLSFEEEFGRDARLLIFRRMQVGVDRLAQQLTREGWLAQALHGGMAQADRTRTIDAYRNGDLRVLIATNVAARGLDIPDITHVINYDIPQNPEEYIHRIGRTARAGKTGVAMTFVGEWDYPYLEAIKAQVGDVLQPATLPIYQR
ncbi:MAG: DEAD-box ATP-dependent RNA helicase DeaD (CshA) [uncultured Thermomicrobiales bacterium]|uniref:DEAD-box ATP-dependent RNA helicase DeaD ( CshA) n=1 Tax=uncultured Thermomicrobiales bacterium TaxID=1645740 RepID=A0A6J4VZ29_9BACT|nr:MAG: DEAD-box ATP-dependent RNA helicase DeaD (CshA) [uncultured Thermomicrobiales bacterium]